MQHGTAGRINLFVGTRVVGGLQFGNLPFKSLLFWFKLFFENFHKTCFAIIASCQYFTALGGRRGCRGCNRIPKTFDLVKIREKSVEIWAKFVKKCAKSLYML